MNSSIDKQCYDFIEEVKHFIGEKDFDFNVKLDWSPKRTRSWGGRYKDGLGISIAMNRYVKPGINRFHEYKSFDSDPIIGGFTHKDYTLCLKAILCHEIAHCWVSHTHYRVKPHGPEWQYLYSLLRKEFINPYIDKTLNAEEEKEEVDSSLYLKHCTKKGCKPEWLNQVFGSGKDNFEVIGWNPRARKYFVIVKRVPDGKEFVMEPGHVAFGFKLKNMEFKLAASRR